MWDVYLLPEDYKFFWQILSLSISLCNMCLEATVLSRSASSKQQKSMVKGWPEICVSKMLYFPPLIHAPATWCCPAASVVFIMLIFQNRSLFCYPLKKRNKN